MRRATKVAIALVALLAMGVAWWAIHGARESALDDGADTAAVASSDDEAPSPAAGPRARVRARVPEEAGPTAPAVARPTGPEQATQAAPDPSPQVGTVEGHVADAAGATVRISPGGRSCKPDANGDFRIDGLPPRDYEAELWRSGRGQRSRERWRSVFVTAGEVVRADFSGTATLVGTVSLDGAPLADAVVRATTRRAASFEGAETRTGPDGAFRIGDVEPGEYEIHVQTLGDGAFATNVRTATVRAGENRLDLRLGEGDLGGEIAGSVYAKTTNAPLTSSDVQQGGFRFRSVRAGRFEIRAFPRTGSLRPATVGLVLAQGQKLEGVEVVLEPVITGRVCFVVRDEAGKPVPDAVILSSAGGSPEPVPCRDGDLAAGVYVVDLEVGRHVLTVQVFQGTRRAEATVDVREGETTKVEVVLR